MGARPTSHYQSPDAWSPTMAEKHPEVAQTPDACFMSWLTAADFLFLLFARFLG